MTEQKGTYVVTHESYYSGALHSADYSQEIMLLDVGDSAQEIVFRWYNLNNRRPPAAKLEVFSDAFSALPLLSPLWQELASFNDGEMSPEDLVAVLEKLGFQDVTERRWPETTAGERGRLLDVIGDVRRYDDDTLRQIAELVSQESPAA